MISKAQFTRANAVIVTSAIQVMTGTEEYLNRRASIAKKIKELWPEILELAGNVDLNKIDVSETREMVLDDFDKKALGEGLRSVLKQPTSNGADYDTCLVIADVCCVGKWFREVVAKKPIPAFEGQSDDEPELS